MKYAIAIDLGGTSIKAGVVNDRYEILRQGSVPTRTQMGWQTIAADMAELAMGLTRECALEPGDCVGIGVGTPGTCDQEKGVVVYANNLYWENVPLAQEITRLTSLPCRISNDANCAVLGETVAGAARGCSDVVLLTLGTGVGGGVVIGGQLFEGVGGGGTELGHTTLIADGMPCTCGRLGCAESYASATGLIAMAEQAAKAHPESRLAGMTLNARAVYDAADAGDETAIAVTKEYERLLGELAVNMVNVFRPEKLLIGGGVSGRGDKLIALLDEYVKRHSYGAGLAFVSRVECATLGNDAGVIGAAALCLNRPGAQPIRLQPAFKDYLWGGSRLRREFGKQTDMTPLAESWELSCHKAGLSVIENGPWAGRTFDEYVRANPQHVSDRFRADDEFPLLIKLIDAEQMLSVQVHPDDEYARRVERSSGKTEMWYVVDATPGAGIYYGFKEAITKNEMAEAIRSKSLTANLNWVEANVGDVFYIPAGTIHAIGAGMLVAEVQQSSDVTYRMWDYGRVGKDGKTRELHIDKGLDVTVREHREPTLPYQPDRDVPGGRVRHLVNCERFCVDALHVHGLMEDVVRRTSFTSYLCLRGAGALLWEDKSMPISKGESVFLPAGMGVVRIAGDMELLKTRLVGD